MHAKSERIATSLLGAFVIVLPSGTEPPLKARSIDPLRAHGCGDPPQSAEFNYMAPGLKFRHDARELSSKRLQQHLLQPTHGPPGTPHSLQHYVVRLVCRIPAISMSTSQTSPWRGVICCQVPGHPPRPSKCAKLAQSVLPSWHGARKTLRCSTPTRQSKRRISGQSHPEATLRPPSGLLVANR